MMSPLLLRRCVLSALVGASLCGCVSVQGGDKPVQIEATLDVNIKVQKEVDKSLAALETQPAQGAWAATMPAVTGSETKDQAIARLKQRLPAVKQAKAAGLIGETAAGYLEAVNPAQLHDLTVLDLVNAQNTDRWWLSTDVAKETSSTFDTVAQQFAQRIADRAAKGDYFKGADGIWHQKP